MALIRGYMTMSLDGFIADANGSIGFFGRYEGVDHRFNAFFHGVGTCVFGRTTFDHAQLVFRDEWPFAGKRVIVVTSRPLETPHAVEVWGRGAGPELVAHLKAAVDGDVWLVGGGKLQSALLALDAVDRLETRIIPVLLGEGVPMFDKATATERWLKLSDIRAVPQGGVILDYRRLPTE